MPVWHQPLDIDQLNASCRNTLMEVLDIRFEACGDDWLRASMPVDRRTHQPFGMLHGGASVALAESVGSMAAVLTLDSTRELAVGLDINANHLRAVRTGRVTATARPIHIGRRTQVWHIELHNDIGQQTCVSRLTMAVVAREAIMPP